MPESTIGISFRFPVEFVPALDEVVGRDKDESRNLAARRLLIESLHDTARDELREELAEIRHTLATMREDLATACVALLTRQQPVSREQAEAWVRENLLE
jgi:hypothetical protein